MPDPDRTTPVELSNLECGVILTGLSLLLQLGSVDKPPVQVTLAIDEIIGKLTDACEALNGPSPELDQLKAARSVVGLANAVRQARESGS